MNEGIDPMDGLDKSGGCTIPPLATYKTFDQFFDGYKKFLDYYMDLSVDRQYRSYESMNEQITNQLRESCHPTDERYHTKTVWVGISEPTYGCAARSADGNKLTP